MIVMAGGYQSDFLGFVRLQKARGGFIHDKIDISQCCHQFLRASSVLVASERSHQVNFAISL